MFKLSPGPRSALGTPEPESELPHPGKVLDFFFAVLESPSILFIGPEKSWKIFESFPVIYQDRLCSFFVFFL